MIRSNCEKCHIKGKPTTSDVRHGKTYKSQFYNIGLSSLHQIVTRQ